MLGATTTESIVSPVSTPPLASELTESGQKDWRLGVELIDTCMDTYETATYGLFSVSSMFSIPLIFTT